LAQYPHAVQFAQGTLFVWQKAVQLVGQGGGGGTGNGGGAGGFGAKRSFWSE
jgi:hypothetical protein